MDLDKFKQINDSQGHLVGDQVLKRIGKVIKENIRENDLAGRFGGDEFLFLFPNVTIESFSQIQPRLEQIINDVNRNFEIDEEFSISLGSASHSGVQYDGIDSIIAAADFALYKAKEKKRKQYSYL